MNDTTTEEVNSIARQIDEIIRDSVRERMPEREYSEQLEQIFWRFKSMLQDARFMQVQNKEDGLTFSSVETEGYLRAMMCLEDMLIENTDYTKD